MVVARISPVEFPRVPRFDVSGEINATGEDSVAAEVVIVRVESIAVVPLEDAAALSCLSLPRARPSSTRSV